MAPVNATLEYTKNAVMTSSRAKLVVMMYEGAIRYVEQARFHLDRKSHAACGTAISNAYNVISELKVCLDYESGGEIGRDISTNLERLYTFMLETLVTVNSSRDPENLDHVRELLGTLKSAWDEIVGQA
ncbi:MAG: flagellar export chaperone FliS [Planctomycetes bacterium]|nr:flagellar export chaperone FliS [Planctomycetota bacterium]